MVTMSLSNVTAPVRANSLPFTIAPVPTEIDACARMVPLNVDAVLSVAELPTCQKMLHALARLISVTVLLTDVVSVLAIWKMNTAFASPKASNVRSPEVISRDEVDL